jgi:hypothetical protein
MARTSEARITYTPLAGTTSEVELNGLATVYRFLLLEKGDRHDLTNDATKEFMTRQDKKGNDSADLHGD